MTCNFRGGRANPLMRALLLLLPAFKVEAIMGAWSWLLLSKDSAWLDEMVSGALVLV